MTFREFLSNDYGIDVDLVPLADLDELFDEYNEFKQQQ